MKVCIAMSHDNLIIPLIKRGMMSDYAHVNHASVSVHNH